MKRASVVSALLLSLAASQAAFGGVDFSYTEPGGAIRDNLATAFPLTMDSAADPSIVDLELEITGLTHPAPWDLDIYLIDPFGNMLDVQLDRGDQSAVNNLTLIFNDNGSDLPLNPDTPLSTGPWKPEDGTFADKFEFRGTDAWLLLIVDDTPGGTGSFTSWTLRGTVPEPVTLSLLAIGAVATLRRRLGR